MLTVWSDGRLDFLTSYFCLNKRISFTIINMNFFYKHKWSEMYSLHAREKVYGNGYCIMLIANCFWLRNQFVLFCLEFRLGMNVKDFETFSQAVKEYQTKWISYLKETFKSSLLHRNYGNDERTSRDPTGNGGRKLSCIFWSSESIKLLNFLSCK